MRKSASGPLLVYLFNFDSGTFEQVDAVGEPVFVPIHHAFDAGLDDQFGAFQTGRGRNIQGAAFAAVARFGHLGDGVGLGMEDIGLGDAVLVFADVLEAGRRTIVSVRDNHPVFDDEGAYLAAFAVGILGPDSGHFQVSGIEFRHVSSVGTMQGLGWTCESYSVPAKYNCNCNSPKIVTSDGCVTPTSSSTLQGTTCNDYYDRPTCEENGCSWTNANGCTTPSSASSTTGATAAPSTGVTSDPNEKRECYCNTCENGSWVSVAKGNVTKTTCNSMNSGCDDVTWGYVLTGRSCGGSATYTVTFLNANGDGSEFYKACKTNTSGYLTNDCISEISGVCSSWSHSKWNGGAPQSGGVSAASIGAKKFTSDDTYYCVAGTSIHPNGNGGGNNNPTPASASTSGGSTTSNTSCYQCTVNGSTKYTYAKSATEAASNLNGTNCKATADSNCKSSNTPVNPQTGTAGIIVAWLVGLSAIVYSLWYFKRSSSIN